MKVMKLLFIGIFVALGLFSLGCANNKTPMNKINGKKLSASEIKDIFTDKSVSIVSKDGNKYNLIHSKDGFVSGLPVKRSWSITKDGKKCINSRCYSIYDINGKIVAVDNNNEVVSEFKF